MVQKKKKCTNCKKEFSVNTLAKYEGICGKCNSKLKEEAIKIAPSTVQSVYFFGLGVVITLIIGWSLYQVFPELNNTNKNSVFMHCLPAHVGEEVTQDVLNSKKSIIYKQAENKLYTAMAIIDYVLS